MTITIKNLRLKTKVGVSDLERNAEREVVINVSVDYDSTQAVVSDELHDAVDYRKLRDHIVAVAIPGPFKLIETLAERIVNILKTDTRLTRIRVEVDKPGALRMAESVSATLTWDGGT